MATSKDSRAVMYWAMFARLTASLAVMLFLLVKSPRSVATVAWPV